MKREIRRLAYVLEQVRQKKIDEEMDSISIPSYIDEEPLVATVKPETKTITTEVITTKTEGVPNMTDITKIMKVIQKINAACAEIDELGAFVDSDYQREKKSIEKKSAEMIEDMRSKYEAYKSLHFLTIRSEIEALVDLLCQDYDDEWRKTSQNVSEFLNASYEQNEAKLHTFLARINEIVQKLNSVDFDKLVPPVNVEIKGETFITYTTNRANAQNFDHNSSSMRSVNDPKPIRAIIQEIFPYCRKAIACIDSLMSQYDGMFNIAGYNSFVQSSANAWLAEYKAKLDSKYAKRFDELFRDEKAEAIPQSFFTTLKREGEQYDVKINAGTDTYNESITIGDVKLLVEDQPQHLDYIQKSTSLKTYLDHGYLVAPLILNLKQCGNIFLNVNEETYSEATVNFVNQLIIQFLLSFPANRINFCLIDIDNKMGFSQFKSLTKINNNILFKGIIRDDRQLENTIKDMEQTMYKIDDDFLSYNNVPDIFEYNRNFEANPQSVHLFVFVNYPTGMRDDTAKRVMKIIQNGNKSGIFSIIINNKACPLSPGYKPAEYAQFIDYAEKASLVINKNGKYFNLNMGVKNHFEPKKGITVDALPPIIEMLKNSAESNRQKVVPLAQMYSDTDAMAASPRGIPLSARVLDIPIGARGGDIQTLCLKTSGDGSAHGVIIGGTGSGKSNLLHTIIMSACYKYSPEELNIYLLDLKEGVEFKYYEDNRLPHVKLLGVDLKEDLHSALAILKNLRQEVSRRGDLFKSHKISQIDQYTQDGKKLPRILVIIDEIQELFELDEKVGQEAILHLSELFKQGRAFGINILWASQNIPNAPGLKDKVLSQIGNRISLRLNEPDDALDIKIDPKVVRNLNRPEKGLGVINDMRYGNDSIEFRVAYAEEGDNRKQYTEAIVEKWKPVTDSIPQEPLFIVGGDEEASPISNDTLYAATPSAESIVSKAFESYPIQLGQDYVTGKPFEVNLALRQNKMNLLLSGGDIEVVRDMMGYTMLSLVLNQLTNADWYADKTKIYYANGEMLNPKNSEDLFNVVRADFGNMIENISSADKIANCIRDVYKLYKERILDPDNAVEAKRYAPCFIVIHSMQRYSELFVENPSLRLREVVVEEKPVTTPNIAAPSSSSDMKTSLFGAGAFFAAAKSRPTDDEHTVDTTSSVQSKMPDKVFFSDAFKELLKNGGEVGIHFIISIDNPLGIPVLKNSVTETIDFKVFAKGVDSNAASQLLGDYKVADSLKNPKVAMMAHQGDKMKFRVYRYDAEQDTTWYKAICQKYSALGGDRK